MFNDYIKDCMRTAPLSTPQEQGMKNRIFYGEQVQLLHAAMGMQTETAEFTDMLKKHIIYGKLFDKVNALEEIGDVLWYISLALFELDSSYEEVMNLNIAKLRKRFPEKFEETQAIHRDVAAERKVLEGGTNA